MNLKEELKKLKNKLSVFLAVKAIADHFASIRNISLDAKIDDYIKWNFENMVKGEYTNFDEHWV